MLKDNGSIWSKFNLAAAKQFLWQKEFGADHPSRTFFVEWLKSRKFKTKPTLLDIPCGAGVDYPLLKDLVDYTGMDKTQVIVKAIKDNFPGVKAETMDIRDMLIPTEGFDIVYARAIFEHLPDLQNTKMAIRECYRVAKHWCILSFYIPPSDKEIIAWNGEYFENTYRKKDIDEIVESLHPKSVACVDVPAGKGFNDDYKIWFLEK